jgi:ABC-type transport system substrate-binding protein
VIAKTYRHRTSARLTRRRLLGSLGAGVVVSGLACTSGTTVAPAAPTAAPAAAAPAAAATPTPAAPAAKYGGTFTLNGGNSSWPHMDPHDSSSSALFGLGLGLAYNRLMKLKLEGVEMPAYIPTPDLAEAVEQPDDLTYILKLRRGVKFHNIAPVNGRELVAEDVAYSFKRQIDLRVNASLLAGIARVETPDRYTVKITTEAPDADFLLGLAAPQSVIVAREAVELKGDLKEGPIIGTGGFVLESADKTRSIEFVKNPDYFVRGRPYLDRWRWVPIPDPAQAQAAARTNQVDVITTLERPDAEAIVRANPKMRTYEARGFGSGVEFSLNLRQKPFDDPRVRKAIYMAIDAQAIIDTVWDGQGFHTVGIPVPSLEWTIPQDEMKRLYRQDLEGARRLLGEAGLSAGFEFELAVTNVLTPIVPTAELIQQWLGRVGVKANLRVVDFATYTQLRQRGPYEGLLGTAATEVSASGALGAKWRSGGGLNSTGVADPVLDKMIDDQRRQVRDAAARRKLVLDIQRYILDNGYMRMVNSFIQSGVVATRVKGLVTGAGVLNIEMDRWNLIWIDE